MTLKTGVKLSFVITGINYILKYISLLRPGFFLFFIIIISFSLHCLEHKKKMKNNNFEKLCFIHILSYGHWDSIVKKRRHE